MLSSKRRPMSITTISSDPERGFSGKPPFHRRKESAELDVFEAAKYFSDSGNATVTIEQKVAVGEENNCRGNRVRLDVPLRPLPSRQPAAGEKQRKEKIMRPSSPGGRLASFLNSLFGNQSASKKKSKFWSQSAKDEEESQSGRRKRSSISRFGSSSTSITTDSKTIYCSSSSGFRTPPTSLTPAHGFYKNHPDHKQQPYSQCNGVSKSSAMALVLSDDKRNRDLTWLGEKFKFISGLSEKHRICISGCAERDRIWVDRNSKEENEIRKLNEVDDDEDADSDSSSDLFELQIYDSRCYPSGLPVYETTSVTKIKRPSSISSSPFLTS